MKKKICPTCHGNGYVPEADPQTPQTAYVDCGTCDSQCEIHTAVTDHDTVLQDTSKSFPQFWRKFTNQSTLGKWTT